MPTSSNNKDSFWDKLVENSILSALALVLKILLLPLKIMSLLVNQFKGSLVWLPTVLLLRGQGQSSSDLLQSLLGLNARSGANCALALALPVAHVLLGFLGPMMMLAMDKLPALSRLTFSPASGQRHSHHHPSDTHVGVGGLADSQQQSCGVIGRPLQISTMQTIPWASIRNYLFAPLAEEWCFRACMVPILLAQGWSSAASIWWSTGLFGAAHLHLLMEMLLHEGMDIKAAIIAGALWEARLILCSLLGLSVPTRPPQPVHRSGSESVAPPVHVPAVLFQFAYTSCFGAYAANLLLQSGTILAPIGAHIACTNIPLNHLLVLFSNSMKPAHIDEIADTGILILRVSYVPGWK
ncbi:hypothetical protein WJX84_010723 [Apatococcus fuscideae]|uniref:intramembrane prenyl-peptidase Rce1 n=1 Tax=Apatococcus fuscideae TaxID=2026836 RepID=A0AAW1SXD6_9CHLO